MDDEDAASLKYALLDVTDAVAALRDSMQEYGYLNARVIGTVNRKLQNARKLLGEDAE